MGKKKYKLGKDVRDSLEEELFDSLNDVFDDKKVTKKKCKVIAKIMFSKLNEVYNLLMEEAEYQSEYFKDFINEGFENY